MCQNSWSAQFDHCIKFQLQLNVFLAKLKICRFTSVELLNLQWFFVLLICSLFSNLESSKNDVIHEKNLFTLQSLQNRFFVLVDKLRINLNSLPKFSRYGLITLMHSRSIFESTGSRMNEFHQRKAFLSRPQLVNWSKYIGNERLSMQVQTKLYFKLGCNEALNYT